MVGWRLRGVDSLGSTERFVVEGFCVILSQIAVLERFLFNTFNLNCFVVAGSRCRCSMQQVW